MEYLYKLSSGKWVRDLCVERTDGDVLRELCREMQEEKREISDKGDVLGLRLHHGKDKANGKRRQKKRRRTCSRVLFQWNFNKSAKGRNLGCTEDGNKVAEIAKGWDGTRCCFRPRENNEAIFRSSIGIKLSRVARTCESRGTNGAGCLHAKDYPARYYAERCWINGGGRWGLNVWEHISRMLRNTQRGGDRWVNEGAGTKRPMCEGILPASVKKYGPSISFKFLWLIINQFPLRTYFCKYNWL